MNKILLIGCGHMGSALVDAWFADNNFKITIIDPKQFKRINKKYNKNIISYKSIDEIKDFISFDIIIFAIKPQIAHIVLKNLQSYNLKFKKNIVFVSIVAGKKINYFSKFLPKKNQFVRVMPNMPALINEGSSCLVSNKKTTNFNIKKIDSLFSKVGLTFWFKNEKEINIATAISGSGPAYVFLFIDAFEKAARKIGLKEKYNKKLIYQTLLGSVKLLLNENKSAEYLAGNIAVKGGTTEAALKILMKNKNFHKIISKAVKAAYNKANQLGK